MGALTGSVQSPFIVEVLFESGRVDVYGACFVCKRSETQLEVAGRVDQKIYTIAGTFRAVCVGEIPEILQIDAICHPERVQVMEPKPGESLHVFMDV